MSDTDSKLGLKRTITRRDFLNGVAIGTLGAALPAPLEALSSVAAGSDYPPRLEGLRGSHVGSFEVAHALAWEGKSWERPRHQTDDDYDLVVVGAGLSGLSAANSYQDKTGNRRKVLILDNHDDFGGHAKRNEFQLNGKTHLATGGSELFVPLFTPESMALLNEMSVDLERLANAKDVEFYLNRDLHQGVFFDEEHYGANRLVVGKHPAEYEWERDLGLEWGYTVRSENAEDFLRRCPVSEKARNEILALYKGTSDYFPGKSGPEVIAILKKISYSDFLRKYAGVSEEVVDLFRACPEVTTGVGLDAVSAFQAFGFYRLPGLDLESLVASDDEERSWKSKNPMPKHTPVFPDGNSSLARMLVRRLIPEVASGSTMEDVVTASFDYETLDQASNLTRIRLSSTVVHVVENDSQKVDVTYVRDGLPYRVRAKHCILASHHTMNPYICPSLPSDQKQAMSSQTKIPIVYANVLISNWRAFEKLGIDSVYCPHGSFPQISLDYPVSMGGYEYSDHPDKPIVVHMRRSFNRPNSGLSARDQYRSGRYELYSKTFEDFERDIRGQLNDILSPAGFDPASDIKAITVNRWPHGYCYKQNYLFDPEYPPGQAPHEIARRPFGNIAIANADSAGFTTIFFAMEHGHRAVDELLA